MIRKFFDPSLNGAGGTIKTIEDATAAVIEMKKNQEAFLTAQKAATESLTAENATLKASLATMASEAKANQTALNELLEAAKTKNIHGGLPENEFTQIGKMLTEKEGNLKAYKEGNGKGFTLNLAVKAVGNFASATNLTGSYFVTPQNVPGVIGRPYEETHMRDLLPVGNTTSNVIRYVRDNGGEGVPAMVAEGGTKPQMDRDLQIYDANVRKIAVHMRLPEEMMEDIPYLQSFLTQIAMEEVMVVEDTQILYGDGTGQNLSGLFTNATAFAAGTSVIGASANQFDVLRAARKQARLARRYPSVALVNPGDYFDMTTKKDTTNNYLFLGGGNGINLTPNIDGMRIIEHTSIVAGDFLVMDPRSAAIFDRSGMSVRFYDQDQDNAIKNLITIVVEKRLALPIYYTSGLIKGTFATAITDLTS